MSIEILGAIVGVGSPLVLVIYWVSKLEGRVDAHDRQAAELREDIAYIRERIDAALIHKH